MPTCTLSEINVPPRERNHQRSFQKDRVIKQNITSDGRISWRRGKSVCAGTPQAKQTAQKSSGASIRGLARLSADLSLTNMPLKKSRCCGAGTEAVRAHEAGAETGSARTGAGSPVEKKQTLGERTCSFNLLSLAAALPGQKRIPSWGLHSASRKLLASFRWRAMRPSSPGPLPKSAQNTTTRFGARQPVSSCSHGAECRFPHESSGWVLLMSE